MSTQRLNIAQCPEGLRPPHPLTFRSTYSGYREDLSEAARHSSEVTAGGEQRPARRLGSMKGNCVKYLRKYTLKYYLSILGGYLYFSLLFIFLTTFTSLHKENYILFTAYITPDTLKY